MKLWMLHWWFIGWFIDGSYEDGSKPQNPLVFRKKIWICVPPILGIPSLVNVYKKDEKPPSYHL